MLIQLFCVVFSLFLGNAQPLNYYPTYSSAKAAARESQKEMVIFFTSRTCSNCESAWSAFTKDSKSTQQYISVKMDMDDFDGGVCFDLYELKQVPSWVIITPTSGLKEKWNGGWKDEAGNPTAFDMSESQTAIKEEKKILCGVQTSQIPSSTTTSMTGKENQLLPKEASTSKLISSNSDITTSTSSGIPSTGNLVLQAGYFGSEANAQKLISDLKSKGFTNFKMETVPKDGSYFYRVVSKSYSSELDMNAEQQLMLNKGIKTSVKKI
ncbi:MAG: SPOR domain-containing protein [Saprospiraceae bacterium]